MTDAAPTTPTPTDAHLAVDARAVSKAYGRAVALRSVDLALGWGRVLAVFGHNGAGKSTLLRVLATLTRPAEGAVAVAGFDARTQSRLVRASVGYAGHADLLYDDLTAEENLRFYASLYGDRAPAGRVAQALADVGAASWARRRTRTLSNGMRKRVAIARAILHQPPVLLLDEPDAGLDVEAQRLVDTVVRAVADAGGAVVLTSHDPRRGLAVADDYAVLRDGRVAASGPADGMTPDGVAALLSRAPRSAGGRP